MSVNNRMALLCCLILSIGTGALASDGKGSGDNKENITTLIKAKTFPSDNNQEAGQGKEVTTSLLSKVKGYCTWKNGGYKVAALAVIGSGYAAYEYLYKRGYGKKCSVAALNYLGLHTAAEYKSLEDKIKKLEEKNNELQKENKKKASTGTIKTMVKKRHL